MKLESTLPEKPGWIFFTPGFDFVLMLLAMVLFTGVVASESLVEVKPPPSEFRGLRLREDRFVVVTVTQGREGEVFYLGRERIEKGAIEGAIEGAANDRETENLAVRCDASVSLEVEQWLIDMAARLDLRYFRVVKSAEVAGGR